MTTNISLYTTIYDDDKDFSLYDMTMYNDNIYHKKIFIQQFHLCS